MKIALISLLGLTGFMAGRAQTEGPLSPERALAAFRLEPGLRVDLVAAEPVTVDPVAMAFDERGRIYVAENRGYPTGPAAGQRPAGVVALLEDEDQDGRYEKRTVFAEGLTFPNGVLPWRGGVFVTCAPDIFYFKDTNGDGRADIQQVVFTGFATNGSTQLRVNHPALALDGWIYVASGLSGGNVGEPDHPEHPLIDLKSDFRFRPDGDAFEPADGRGQFGLDWDDFGRRFVCMNRVQVQHVVMASRYLARNPFLAFSETMQNCPEARSLVPSALREPNAATRIFPISANITTADSHAGTFTAACGLTIYRGTALPEEYYGNALSCDPTGNLVHRDKLAAAGATFIAERAREGVELLASTDNWFRPVFLANGPDGALYLCDMYRKTIEHPDYLPEEIRKRTDFESGKGMGRIWRVSRADRHARGLSPDLGRAGAAELVAALFHPDAWTRETAFRLLLQRHEESAVPLLQASLKPQAPAAGAVAALRVLDALGGLREELLERALSDAHPGVRENAIQLAETRLGRSARLQALLRSLANDPDARVRFQCALSLGTVPGPLPPDGKASDAPLITALARIALSDSGDRWTRAAVLSSAAGHEEGLLKALLVGGKPVDAEGMALLLGQMGRGLGSSSSRAGPLDDVLRAPIDFDSKAAFLTAYAGRIRERVPAAESNGSAWAAVSAALTSKGLLGGLLHQAGLIATNSAEPVTRRVRALSLLGLKEGKASNALLLSLLEPHEPPELQRAAAGALIQPGNTAAIESLLRPDRWQNYTAGVRSALLSSLLSRAEFVPHLLSAIESGGVPASALDSGLRNQLLKHKEDAIRLRAETLLARPVPDQRMRVFEEYKSVLTLKPDAENGRFTFKKHCAACHRLDREGVAVGPDLFGVRNQSKETLLLHVIIPEYEIAPSYTSYVIELKDGRTISGLIASESSTTLTLRRALGEEESVLRSSIASIAASNLSIMPQELEKNMTRQELADLLAYLKGEANGPVVR